MFNKDFQIRGTYATYWKSMAKTQADDDKTNFKVFERYIDVYMLAPVLGALFGRVGHIDPQDTCKDTAGMLAEVIMKNQPKLTYVYRLVMLLDATEELGHDAIIGRAFRDDTNPEAMAKNMSLFNSYFLGGLEILYENFTNSCTTDDDYIDRIFSFVDEFKKEQDIDSLEADIEELLRSKVG
jgi:hypothetical protein